MELGTRSGASVGREGGGRSDAEEEEETAGTALSLSESSASSANSSRQEQQQRRFMQRLVVADLPFMLCLFALSSCMGEFRSRIRKKSKAIIGFSVSNINVM